MHNLLRRVAMFFGWRPKMKWLKCMACGVKFKADADNVPCGYDQVGDLRPLCSDCVNTSNRNRRFMGIEEKKIIQGVYDATDKGKDL